jgi:hypothetical protein
MQGRRTRGTGAKKQTHPTARAPRPFEPGRAEPPLPTTDDLEPYVAPPLRAKEHPPGAMDQATPSRDDEVHLYHRPRDEGATAFAFDPDAADAAADLAGDLGATFLTGATRGEDVSEVVASAEEVPEDELPLVEEEGEGELASPRDEEEQKTRRSGRRRRARRLSRRPP